MTLSFTPAQILWAIGAICIIILIIFLIRMVIEITKTVRQYREVGHNVNEMLEDIHTTKMVVMDRIADFKKMTDVVKKFQEFKEKRERKQEKKNKKAEKKLKEQL